MSIYQEVSLIIVCYKSDKFIEKNLNIIKKFNTIIVDNSNSILTHKHVKGHSNIKYIISDQNIGYGRANNIGVKNCDTPYFMILNPDILINESAIQILYDKFNKYDNTGILAPSLYDNNYKRRTNGSFSRLKDKPANLLNSNLNNMPDGDTCYDYVIGCSLFMRKDFFEHIGGFDNDFFMYFEDNEICDRVYKFKKTVIEVPDSRMIHIQGLSSEYNVLQSAKLSLIHKVSEYIYYQKNFTKPKLYFIIFKNILDYTQRSIINFILFRFKKSFKNILRLISIFLFLTKSYYLIF